MTCAEATLSSTALPNKGGLLPREFHPYIKRIHRKIVAIDISNQQSVTRRSAMEGRRRSDTEECLVDLPARLPRWINLSLSLPLCRGRHDMAAHPSLAAQAAKQVGGLQSAIRWQAQATVRRPLMSLICLLGASVSMLRRRKRRALSHQASEAPVRTRCKACCASNSSWPIRAIDLQFEPAPVSWSPPARTAGSRRRIPAWASCAKRRSPHYSHL